MPVTLRIGGEIEKGMSRPSFVMTRSRDADSTPEATVAAERHRQILALRGSRWVQYGLQARTGVQLGLARRPWPTAASGTNATRCGTNASSCLAPAHLPAPAQGCSAPCAG